MSKFVVYRDEKMEENGNKILQMEKYGYIIGAIKK